MKRKLSLAAFTLLFLVNAVATGIRTALAAAPAELLEKGRQGPFPTLPPLSITLTPPAFPVEPTRPRRRDTLNESWPGRSARGR